MKQGIKTAASIALATTCVATASLRSEAGKTPPIVAAHQCQMQESVASNGSEIVSPVLNQGTRTANEESECPAIMRESDGKLQNEQVDGRLLTF